MDLFPDEKLFEEKIIPNKKRRILLVILIIFTAIAVLFGSVVAQTIAYSNKVYPGVHVGGVSISKMTSKDLEDFLQSMNDKLISEGLNISFQNSGKTERLLLPPVIVTEGNAIELMSIDIEKEVERLINYGKEGGVLSRSYSFLQNRFSKTNLKLKNIIIDKKRITNELKDRLREFEIEPVEASVQISSIQPLEYEITNSQSGSVFQYEDTINKLSFAWSLLEVPNVEINRVKIEPGVKEKDVENIVSRLPEVFDKGSITINYRDSHTRILSEWFIGVSTLTQWMNVQKTGDGDFAFGLNKDMVVEYLETNIEPKILVEVRDAKFEIDGEGKTVEFQGSRPGVELDFDGTYLALNEAFLQRTRHDEGVAKTVQLAINQVEPNVRTGEVNDLGISEILGIGVSDFSGSPPNRIKNIKNAIKKLNGVLIKPGEEFSAIKYTEPYTIDGGYLPELVIKGDEIKPEIGGGLCQIGTTLFRMAMNSGMPITQRRNHSLVVDYYNDLENGLPGTDATIYDPFPDFRFKNDTDSHLLIQTNINEEEGRLNFILWGTNDGRKGWYEPPEVEKWIDYGETKYIETTDLAPGKEKCQHAFKGAKTSFKYVRELPDGEQVERVFESYYRPLPRICLVGVAEKIESCEVPKEGEEDTCAVDLSLEEGEIPIIVE